MFKQETQAKNTKPDNTVKMESPTSVNMTIALDLFPRAEEKLSSKTVEVNNKTTIAPGIGS
jgi:hypothetical protein